MNNNKSTLRIAAEHLKKYAVTYLFVAISLFFVIVSGLDMNYVVGQLLLRLNRNAFIVLALIIPIIAGMGINFAITIGAMAAQIGLLLTINWEVTGLQGILLAAAITLPLAAFFGFLIGKLLNRMKGQETIGSMILGYFANGAYQLLFLFIFGNIIPLNENVTIVGGTGVQNTLNLTGDVDLYKAIDKVLTVSFTNALHLILLVLLLMAIVLFVMKKISQKKFIVMVAVWALVSIAYQIPAVNEVFTGMSSVKESIAAVVGQEHASKAFDLLYGYSFANRYYAILFVVMVASIALFLLKKLSRKAFIVITAIWTLIAVAYQVPVVRDLIIEIRFTNFVSSLMKDINTDELMLKETFVLFRESFTANANNAREIKIPVVTWMIIGCLCLLNAFIMKTRLGQKFRAVGQNRVVANAAGINVNRTRIIAIMISTVLAGWGQIMFMQSEGIGTFQTYAAHEQVGLYAGAAILVGGASIDKATNAQALIGTFLFHSLFITAQNAASNLFGDANVGEYFRAFLSYGVIALALVIYSWRSAQQRKSGLSFEAEKAQRAAKS